MKFLLLTTGGTIASVASEHGFIAALPGEKLLEACPHLADFQHDIEIKNIFSKDSSNMNPLDWLEMAQCVRENASGKDGVVLLHGTDTLAWTSSALSFLLNDVSIPVVISGSMLTPEAPDSDVPENIYTAFQFALQLAQCQRKGVSVAFAGHLIHGPKATKIDSHRKNAFVSVDYPLLGRMQDDEGRMVAWLDAHVPALSEKRFWTTTPELETDIALVPVFPGMKVSWLDAIINVSPKAIVLEGYGLGGIPYMHENLLEPIARGIEKGIPFVLRTQAPFGGTDPTIYEVGKRALDLGVLSARDMTREALMVKLMLLLPLRKGKELEVQLNTNLCDEVLR